MNEKKPNQTTGIDSKEPIKSDKKDGLSRRQFNSGVAAVAATSAVPLAGCTNALLNEPIVNFVEKPPLEAPSTPNPESLDYFDRYRNAWTWTGTQKATHHNNCGLQAQCSFNVYTRDGNVIREEQAAIYPQLKDKIPDYNPRGCQKGCGYSKFMTNESRLTKPLKRVGERGSGQWEEVSWDEALTAIAGKMVDVLETKQSDSIVVEAGPDAWYGSTQMVGVLRFWQTFDMAMIDPGASGGDDQQGFHVTYGDFSGGRTPDDYFYSDLVFIWNGNPAYTQIPLYHFITEARYNGAKIISIAPDMNASAMHADLWVSVRPGTDAALALGMAREIISSRKYDADLLREQTDMSCLVRVDNGKMLTEADFKKRGDNEPVYYYDLTEQEVVVMDVDTLVLGDRVPALEGEYEVETRDGIIKVKPVFEMLKEQLEYYTLEKTSEICGVAAKMVKSLAHQLADAKAATNVANTAQAKNHHGDVITRSQILVFTLAGHLGRHGAGFDSLFAMAADGMLPLLKDSEIGKEKLWGLLKEHGPRLLKDMITGGNFTRAKSRAIRNAMMDLQGLTPGTLFYQEHTGNMELQGKPWDANYKREVKDYVKDAIDIGTFFVHPAKDNPPSIFFNIANNQQRSIRLGQKVVEVLYPKIDLLVAVDLRLTSTAMYSDYVLPAQAAYEFDDVMICQYTPFVHATTKATTVGDTKGDWEILQLITKKVQEISRDRKVKHFMTRHGEKRRLDRVYDQISMKGRINENAGPKVAKIVTESSTMMNGISFDELKEKGFVRANSMGMNPFVVDGQASEILEDEPTYPHSWHLEKKEPWITRSGRVQFYIDHDWFLEAKEQLPAHKEPPKVGGDYPVAMTGGHNRWSIHSQQRTDSLLLRLQRGEPSMWINAEDAAERGIEDNDRIRVFNDVGEFYTRAKVSAQTRNGQVIMYHAWESYQFEGKSSHRSVMESKIKPIELVRDYPLFQPVAFGSMQPGLSDRDTKVNYERAM